MFSRPSRFAAARITASESDFTLARSRPRGWRVRARRSGGRHFGARKRRRPSALERERLRRSRTRGSWRLRSRRRLSRRRRARSRPVLRRACKTPIAADFRVEDARLGARSRDARGARRARRRSSATHVLRARVAGGMEWNDETNGETNDDDTTEREATRHVANDDVADGERRADAEESFLLEASESKTRYDDDDETRNASERSRTSSDENWLDDDRFGCSPGQLWVNAVASIGATQNSEARVTDHLGGFSNEGVFAVSRKSARSGASNAFVVSTSRTDPLARPQFFSLGVA